MILNTMFDVCVLNLLSIESFLSELGVDNEYSTILLSYSWIFGDISFCLNLEAFKYMTRRSLALS